jgi:hypothetical protein
MMVLPIGIEHPTEHIAPQNTLKHCLRCDNLVQPVFLSKRRMSSKSNLPGMLGIYKTVACCPECGDTCK